MAEAAVSQRELDLKEREVAAKEREIASKEKELDRSRWLNPTVIAIFVAAIGLISSVIVARLNNTATQELERQRAQSTIILEAIRTGTGNTDASCRNLAFLANLGLIDDPKGTIHKQCVSVPEGIPSLPAATQFSDNVTGRNKVAETIRTLENPISALRFSATLIGGCRQLLPNRYDCHDGDQVRVSLTNDGPVDLFVYIIDIGATLNIGWSSDTPIRVRANQTYILPAPLTYGPPYGTDTMKIFAAKQPLSINVSSGLPVTANGAKLSSADWGVVDVVSTTEPKVKSSMTGGNSQSAPQK